MILCPNPEHKALCIAKALLQYGVNATAPPWSGLFYVHFDAAVSPCTLAKTGFDKTKMAVLFKERYALTFRERNWCNWNTSRGVSEVEALADHSGLPFVYGPRGDNATNFGTGERGR